MTGNSDTSAAKVPHTGSSGERGDLSLHDAFIPLIILAAVLAVYLPGINGSFLHNWDDNRYVVENAAAHGFSLAHLKSAFTGSFVGNYAPLHIVSYMMDYTLWGLAPQGYRGVNILLHAANGTLLYHLFRRMKWQQTPAVLAALLFVLHPVQVESVIWISQRKTVLSLFFSLWSCLLYVRASDSGRSGFRPYVPALVLLALALLTKSAAVFLPLVYLAYEIVMKNNRAWPRLLGTLLPFLLLSLVICIVTLTTQHEARVGWHGGSPLATLYTMLPVFMSYFGMLVMPVHLSALYDPVIRHALFEPAVIGSLLVLAALVIWVHGTGRRSSERLFWFWFALLAIIPVSQIVPLTTMMNDRYLYYPMVGIAAILAGEVSTFISAGGTRGRVVMSISILVLILLAVASGRRTLVWKDELTLWSDAVQKSPGSRFARQGLAEALEAGGDLAGAAAQYLEALKDDPASPELNSQAGVVFAELKDFARALPLLRAAVRYRPANGTYRMNLAAALLESGAYRDALAELKSQEGAFPPTLRSNCMLGALYEKTGDRAAAALYYDRAGQIDGGRAQEECAAIREIVGLH